MRYVSTRGSEPFTFADTVLKGTVNKGLLVPEVYPTLTQGELKGILMGNYDEIVASIVSKFDDESSPSIPTEVIDRLAGETYTDDNFKYRDEGFKGQVAPVKEIAPDIFVQDLSCGPTLAFKDQALQYVTKLMNEVLASRGQVANVLGASSGDTFIAAEAGVAGLENIAAFFLTPRTGMSEFQKAHGGYFSMMFGNIHNIALERDFSFCQDDIVKPIMDDEEFSSEHNIAALNSVNWARPLAQVPYTFAAYRMVTRKEGEVIDVAIPSGNFGNGLSVYIAKMMGLPIGNIIIGTNENDALDYFFAEGIYAKGGRQRREEALVTINPSMDIQSASNLERLLFDATGRNVERLRKHMETFKQTGVLDLRGTPEHEYVERHGFKSMRVDEVEAMMTMMSVYQDSNTIIDPHTAVAVEAGYTFKRPGVKMVCLSTAKPTKFEGDVSKALHFIPPRHPDFVGMEEKFGGDRGYDVLEPTIEAVKAYIAEHGLR